MLRAYDYSEPRRNKIEIQNSDFFNKEKEIALNYVLTHHPKVETTKCPICGGAHTSYIFSRWDIEYQFCKDCFSIYVSVESKIMADYLALGEMKNLRISSEYQEQARIRRNNIWDEQVIWAQYRIFRYLGKNEKLEVIDYGNRYLHHIEKYRDSGICGKYDLRESILSMKTDHVEKADIILYLNQLQHEIHPIKTLTKVCKSMKENGLLILNTRLGSGFDILTLKGGMDSIFPYEHVMLPSRKGLEIILDKAGFELLEITTPGTRDMESVLKNKEKIEDGNFFVKYLLHTADDNTISDFQQFLQKSGLSSFAQVVAKVKAK